MLKKLVSERQEAIGKSYQTLKGAKDLHNFLKSQISHSSREDTSEQHHEQHADISHFDNTANQIFA